MTPTIQPEDREQNSNTGQLIPQIPKHFRAMVDQKLGPFHNRLSYRAGALELWKVLNEAKWGETVTLEHRLASLTAERDVYRKAMEEIKRDIESQRFPIGVLLIIANDALNQYPSPKQQDNGPKEV